MKRLKRVGNGVVGVCTSFVGKSRVEYALIAPSLEDLYTILVELGIRKESDLVDESLVYDVIVKKQEGELI